MLRCRPASISNLSLHGTHAEVVEGLVVLPVLTARECAQIGVGVVALAQVSALIALIAQCKRESVGERMLQREIVGRRVGSLQILTVCVDGTDRIVDQCRICVKARLCKYSRPVDEFSTSVEMLTQC